MISLETLPKKLQPSIYKVNDSYRTATFTITSGNVLNNKKKKGYIYITGIVEVGTIILIPEKEIMTVSKVEGNEIRVYRNNPTTKLRKFDVGYCIGYKGNLTYTSKYPKSFKVK